MPDVSDELHTTLRTIAEYAGLAVTDADLEAVAGAVDAARGRLAALRSDLAETEEPGSVFSTRAGGASS